MGRLTSILITVSIVFVSGITTANACSWVMQSVEGYYDNASEVVLAQVVKVTEHDRYKIAELHILEQYKGAPMETLKLPALGMTNCEYDYSVGELWVLFLTDYSFPGMHTGSFHLCVGEPTYLQ